MLHLPVVQAKSDVAGLVRSLLRAYAVTCSDLLYAISSPFCFLRERLLFWMKLN